METKNVNTQNFASVWPVDHLYANKQPHSSEKKQGIEEEVHGKESMKDRESYNRIIRTEC